VGYGNVRRRSYRRRRTGYSSPEALQHIEEARAFTQEVGGVDKDVKTYFFSLSAADLSRLLDAYGARHGRDTEAYAKEAYASWKSGRRQMSGLVAKRLFNLLPARMPLQMKYGLVKKLWDHFCPKSRKVYYIDENADINVLSATVGEHLERQVQDYYISTDLSKRFDWLAAGDVHVRQQLENYFQQLKKAQIGDALRERLRVIESHIGNSPEDHRIQEIRIGNIQPARARRG
jgi:hypothetical protein